MQPGRCCKLGVSCRCVPWARRGRGQQGTGAACRGRAALGRLTAVCCPPLPAVLHQQHRVDISTHLSDFLFQQNVCFGKAPLPLPALGWWLSCSSASARFVLHLELLLQLHPGTVARVPPLLLELWLLQKPLVALPEQPPLCGSRGRAGRAACGCWESAPAHTDNRGFLSIPLSGPLCRMRISIGMEECVK